MSVSYKAAWLGTKSYGDAASIAVDGDGHMVGSWVSSCEGFARQDLPRCFRGLDVELVWVAPADLPPACPGCSECRPDEAAGGGGMVVGGSTERD